MNQIEFKRPHKAVDVKELEELSYPIIAMLKYDGVYAINVKGNLLARSLKPFRNEFITNKLSKPEYEGFVGELCYGNILNSQSLCRDTTSKANTIKGDWEYTWVLFDYIDPSVIGLPFRERLKLLHEAVHTLPPRLKEGVDIAWYNWEKSPNDVEGAYNLSLEDGYEGLILRSPDSLYKNGRSTLREQGFLRMKPQEDFEAVIIDVIEAQENNNEAITNELGYTERSSHADNKVGKGMVGSFIAIDVITGLEIKIAAGKLTHEERKYFFTNKPIGAISKYRSMTTGVKDLPRFPRHYSFRADEDLDESVLNKVVDIRSRYV